MYFLCIREPYSKPRNSFVLFCLDISFFYDPIKIFTFYRHFALFYTDIKSRTDQVTKKE